jgi:hypothetical protein
MEVTNGEGVEGNLPAAVNGYQKRQLSVFIVNLSPPNVFIGGPVKFPWIPDKSFRE